MVRVLVTGAAGGLGRAWARRLEEPGLSLAPAWPGPVEVVACPRGKLDVASPGDSARGVEEIAPDIVLNCAGRVDLEFCERSPWEAFRVNRDGADHIARACARRGALPVYFSSDLVFDGGKLEAYGEEDPPNPLNAFGESKLAGELRTASAARRYLIVRSGWIFGQPGTHFLKAVLEPPIHRMPIRVADQVGQATWVEDFLDAVLFLLRGGRTGRWHVASPGAVTQAEVLRRARRLVGGPEAPIQGRPPDHVAPVPGFTALDGTKLAAAGHEMRGWEAGLEAYIRTIS